MKTQVFLRGLSGSLLAMTVLTGATHAQAAAPAVDPCQVVTIAELEQVFGKVKGTPTKEGEGGMCSYEFANGKDEFAVAVFRSGGFEFERKRSKKPISIKGLGDEAFLDRGMHDIPYVNLYIKKKTATVKLSILETAGDEEKLKMLAQKVVGRF